MTAHVARTHPSPSYLKHHQALVKPWLERALPLMLRELVEMITSYVCHELANQPQRIVIGDNLNSVSLGRISSSEYELILSRVVKGGATKVTRARPDATRGLMTKTLCCPRVPRGTLLSIAREPRGGLFHIVNSTHDAQQRGMLYEEQGGALLPFDRIPERHRRGWPEVTQTYDPHAKKMWRLSVYNGLMAYTLPHPGQPGAWARAQGQAMPRKRCFVREAEAGQDPYLRSSLLITALPSERMVVVTPDIIKLFATDVAGRRGCKLIAKAHPPALEKRYSEEKGKIERFYEPFTAATCTPDHTRFFAATRRQAITVFSIENDRIHRQSIDSFLGDYMYTMAAHATAVAMTTLTHEHHLWDIERREIISSIQEPLGDFHAAFHLMEINLLFARGRRVNPNRWSFVAYDFRTPHSQKSPALKLVL